MKKTSTTRVKYERKLKERMSMEQLQEIQQENRNKLDSILSNPDWEVELAKKYYGDKWMSVIERHPDKEIHVRTKQRENSKNVKLRKEGTFVPKAIPNTKKPLIQLDMEGNVVRKWKNVSEYGEVNGITRHNLQSIMNCISNTQRVAFGHHWRVDNEALEDLIKKMETEFYLNLNGTNHEEEE